MEDKYNGGSPMYVSPYVGKKVIFVDPIAKEHDALVTAVWGDDAQFESGVRNVLSVVMN